VHAQETLLDKPAVAPKQQSSIIPGWTKNGKNVGKRYGSLNAAPH